MRLENLSSCFLAICCGLNPPPGDRRLRWERDDKCRTLADPTFDRYLAAVGLHDFSRIARPNPVPFVAAAAWLSA